MAKGSGKGSGKKSAGVGQAVKAVAAAAAPVAAMAGGVAGPDAPHEQFEADLKRVAAVIDKRERAGGLLDITHVQREFVGNGWTKAQFDKAMIEAERRYTIDMKTMDDPHGGYGSSNPATYASQNATRLHLLEGAVKVPSRNSPGGTQYMGWMIVR